VISREMSANPFALLVPPTFWAPVPISPIVFVGFRGIVRWPVIPIWFRVSVIVASLFTRVPVVVVSCVSL
jgi:hypothetical protein